MATEEIEISELEFTEELASDNLIPVEGLTDTKATSLQKLRDWLGIESAILKQVPTGLILPYGGSTAPEGFLLCNGATINRTTYANLFAVIGTTYGTGDGSTTFGIPSASSIVTSVNTSVPVNGNGITLGLTDGKTNFSLLPGNGGFTYSKTGGYGKNIGTKDSGSNLISTKFAGITTDSSKSGIVGTVTRSSVTCKFIIKY